MHGEDNAPPYDLGVTPDDVMIRPASSQTRAGRTLLHNVKITGRNGRKPNGQTAGKLELCHHIANQSAGLVEPIGIEPMTSSLQS